ncbi:hypothetical protein KKA87_14995 [bacterium]|nr:hypothetical protein [bacterium]
MKTSSIMKMKYFLILLAILISGCSIFDFDNNDGPGELDLMLSDIPDTLNIGNTSIILKTYMWRDFQPISPANGKPLIAIFRIITIDSTNLPEGIKADAAWIICKEGIWDTYFSDEEPAEYEIQPYQLYEIARDGPKFGPNIYVDVVVRIIDNMDIEYFLKAENQYIGRTD